MIEINLLTQFNPDDLRYLATGYISDDKYRVSKAESDRQFSLTLELVSLPQPYQKRYNHLDLETMAYYQQVLNQGFSFGAYAGERCVGIVLAEAQQWNGSLWVRELHVAEGYRRRGIGRQLVDALAKKGRVAGLRTMVCETQNTNVPAIHFYRRVGFHIEGIDLSYYSNNDFPDGEIAIFLKKRLWPLSPS